MHLNLLEVMNKIFKLPAALLVLAISLQTGLLHASQLPIYPGLTEGVRQTLRTRYEQSQSTELNKLLYLVDLVSKTDLEIVYDGASYRTPLISPLVRLFVLQHYKNQPAEIWLREWCSTTQHGNPISVRFPNGIPKCRWGNLKTTKSCINYRKVNLNILIMSMDGVRLS